MIITSPWKLKKEKPRKFGTKFQKKKKKKKEERKRPIVKENKENFSNEKGKNNHCYGCGQGN